MTKSTIYFTIIFCIFNFITSENYTCTSDYNCINCNFCGISTKNFTSCFYYHMLCKENNKITYSPYIKNELTNLYENDSDITKFCGQKEYNIDNMNYELIIFNSQNKNFTKNKYIHCHYVLKRENMDKKPYLYFEITKNDNSKEIRKLQFQISNIYKESSDIESSESLNHDTIRKNNFLRAYLETTKTVDIFVDFLELNYTQPEEILKISLIDINKKLSSSSSSAKTSVTILSTISSAIIFILFICLIYYCCCKREHSSGGNTTPTPNDTSKVAAVIIPLEKI